MAGRTNSRARPWRCSSRSTGGFEPSEELRQQLKDHVRKEIGSLAVPDDIRFTASLPKTRSGKIMRRLLRDVAAGRETVGDTTTLEDFSVLARLAAAGRVRAIPLAEYADIGSVHWNGLIGGVRLWF